MSERSSQDDASDPDDEFLSSEDPSADGSVLTLSSVNAPSLMQDALEEEGEEGSEITGATVDLQGRIPK